MDARIPDRAAHIAAGVLAALAGLAWILCPAVLP